MKQKKTHETITSEGSALKKYQDVIVGSNSISFLIFYEFCIFFGKLPGALGLIFRKIFWPKLLGSCNGGVQFGDNIILRHPKRIHLGKNVIISDGCVLDARTSDQDKVIQMGENVILSNKVIISCKGGTVSIGSNVGVGAASFIGTTEDNSMKIGSDVFIGPQCFITGGGDYNFERKDIPIWKQGLKVLGGSVIEDDVWLGANVNVLGGLTISKGSIVGTGSVVTKSIPEYSICMGVPAKVKSTR